MEFIDLEISEMLDKNQSLIFSDLDELFIQNLKMNGADGNRILLQNTTFIKIDHN